MNDAAVLLYLEWRQIANRFRLVVRQPGRLAMYLFAAAYLVFLVYARSHTRHAAFAEFGEPFSSAAFFAFVALTGVWAWGAASGIVHAFSSRADARFLAGSALSQRTVVTWLQLRRSALGLIRGFFSVVLYSIFYGRSTSGILLAVLGGTLLLTATVIPMLKLRATIGQRSAQAVGAAVIAAGLLPLVILMSSLLDPRTTPWANAIERLNLGGAVNALAPGDPKALALLYLAAAAFLCVSFACGSDLYPELYAATLRMASFSARSRRPGAAFVSERLYARSSPSAVPAPTLPWLRGAWTVAWKEWIAFIRSSSLRRTFVLGLIGSLAAGIVLGRIAMTSKDSLVFSVALAGSAGNMLVILVVFMSSVGLASDLQKPMWWMGPDSLWMRLFAWTAATSWRLASCIAMAIAAWAATLRHPQMAAAAALLAVAGVFYLRANGLALYALFPSTFDQRGPMGFVRLLLTYALALPPVLAGIAVTLTSHRPVAGAAVAAAIAMGEALLMITFAASRIAGRGATFSQAEAA